MWFGVLVSQCIAGMLNLMLFESVSETMSHILKNLRVMPNHVLELELNTSSGQLYV